VADDFLRELDAMRKKLHTVFKKLKQRKRKRPAFFNVEKFVIEGVVYRGPETKFCFVYQSCKHASVLDFKSINPGFFLFSKSAN